MKTITSVPVNIEKELISALIFPSSEVLVCPDLRKKRLHDLERATTLGNVEHSKIKITFEDAEGLKKVNTTIWATTDKRIILKQGVVIPIHRIHNVDIF
jgi:uncharacterized protein (UPF0248 family)